MIVPVLDSTEIATPETDNVTPFDSLFLFKKGNTMKAEMKVFDVGAYVVAFIKPAKDFKDLNHVGKSKVLDTFFKFSKNEGDYSYLYNTHLANIRSYIVTEGMFVGRAIDRAIYNYKKE